MYLFIFIRIFVILDDVDRLNVEEKVFIEDLANEEFFDLLFVEKRFREVLFFVIGVVKKMKLLNDEVSRRVRNLF